MDFVISIAHTLLIMFFMKPNQEFTMSWTCCMGGETRNAYRILVGEIGHLGDGRIILN
jgi:hypothetical protein